MRAVQPQSGVVPGILLRAAILQLLREQPDHGYDLQVRLEDLGVETDSGVVYRALRQMEHEGQVTSAWQASDSGPAKRSYELTFDGEDHLQELLADLRLGHQIVEAFLARCEQRTLVFSDEAPTAATTPP